MKLYRLLLPVATVLFCVSCRTTEKSAYIKDASRDSVVTFDAQLSKGIQPHDLLSIYVESETPESTKQYDQDTDKIAVEDGAVIVGTGASAVSGYLVSAEGSIIFPVLGELHVVGMTHDSLAHYIEHRLVQERHIKNPRVTVKLINFKKGVIIKDID